MIECPAHILPLAAKIYGDKVALVTEDAQVSFVELEARSSSWMIFRKPAREKSCAASCMRSTRAQHS